MKTLQLPDSPEPIAVELEITNVCNARCSLCPRENLGRAGCMTRRVFDEIVRFYSEQRTHFSVGRLPGVGSGPWLIFAGSGEPTLHPSLLEFVRIATSHGFRTEAYTNASRLTPELGRGLVKAGLSRLRISFWGTTAAEYEASMRLAYEDTLSRIKSTVPWLQDGRVEVIITWQKAPSVECGIDQVLDFWGKHLPGVDVDMEHIPDNRGGNLQLDAIGPGLASFPPIDFTKEIYCSFAYFTDSVRWNGDLSMCSPDLFASRMQLGNVLTVGLAELRRRKAEAFRKRRFRRICEGCSRYRHEVPEIWDRVLPESEKRKYFYEKQTPRL